MFFYCNDMTSCAQVLSSDEQCVYWDSLINPSHVLKA